MKSDNRKAVVRFFHRTDHELQRNADVGTVAFRFEIKQLADYEKYVLAPFLRRYVFLYFVAEKHHSDFILVLDGGEGKGGGDFRDELALHRAYRTEIAAVGNVDKQQHGQLALLFVDLYRRACCSVR